MAPNTANSTPAPFFPTSPRPFFQGSDLDQRTVRDGAFDSCLIFFSQNPQQTSTNLNIHRKMNEDFKPEENKADLSAKGIWNKLPTESVSSYAAFTAFIELGADASLQQVADKVGRSYGAVSMLSSRHLWMERAEAWRIHLSNLSFRHRASNH